MNWKLEPRRRFYDDPNPANGFEGILSRKGLLSDGSLDVSNAHQVELSYHRGSGFGTAREWPHVKASVNFQAGEEARAQAFAAKLQKLIDDEFPE